MTTKPAIELVLLAAIWGASFMFMRIGSPEFGPVLFMALRTFIASIFLMPLVYLAKQHNSFKGFKLKIFIVGILNTAIPFVLFGYATLTLPAGITSILNATTPMFGAIVAYVWLKQKLTKAAALGLFIGFIGVYLLMLDKIALNQDSIIYPTLAVLLAAFCYGTSANYTKRYLNSLKPIALAAGSQVAASLILVPLSLFFMPATMPSDSAWWSVLLLGVLCTAIAYIIFFRLIAHWGPAKAMSVTYLIPAFGLFWGSLFLDEQITLWMLVGCAFILVGVALTTGIIKMKKTTLA